MILTDLLWPLDYMTLTSLALLCICHLILPPFTLSCDLDTHCIHYLALIFLILIPGPVTLSHTCKNLHWLIKLTKSGLLGETVAVKIQGGVLGRVAPPRALPHVFLLFMLAPVITCYMIPEYSELFLPAIRIH